MRQSQENPSSTNSSQGRIGRLIGHVSIPLYRNAYSLVLSAVVTSGIGVVFWIVAARVFTEEQVGINSTAISMIMLLATLGQLNLVNGLNRFLPRAGRATSRLIGSSYVIAAVAGGAIAGIFLLGLRVWAPDLEFLISGWWMPAWFIFSVMAWAVFVLQDGVLTGLREAHWVPIENVVYSLVKIALIIVLAESVTDTGLFLAWTIPIPPLLIAVNVFVFRRLAPRHVAATTDRAEPISMKGITQFVAGDYVASLIWMSGTRLLPVIVLARVGAASAAHFYLASTIAYTLHLVSRHMGMSMIAEASHDPQGLAGFSYRTARQALLLVMPAALLVVVAAPLILELFGSAYAEAGAPVLRLLVLSAIPSIVTSVYAAVLRAQQRIRALVILMLVQSVGLIGLSYWLLGTQGILGVGIAWIVSQTVVALFILVTDFRKMWVSQIDHRVVEAVAATRDYVGRRISGRALQRQGELALAQIVGQLQPENRQEPFTWEIQRVFPTVSDVTTFALGTTTDRPEATLKLALTDQGTAALDRHASAVQTLNNDPRLDDWKGTLPEVLAVSEVEGRRVLVDQAIAGRPLTAYLRSNGDPAELLESPAALIAELHRRTASSTTANEELVTTLVRRRIDSVRSAIADHPDLVHAVEAVEYQLGKALAGKTLLLSRTHGDFSPGNILVAEGGTELTGIIDWDQTEVAGIPDLDLVFLLLATRMVTQRREFGSVVVSLTGKQGFEDWERNLLERHGLNVAQGLDPTTLALMSWLNHVDSNLTKASGYQGHTTWIERNIAYVLRAQ